MICFKIASTQIFMTGILNILNMVKQLSADLEIVQGTVPGTDPGTSGADSSGMFSCTKSRTMMRQEKFTTNEISGLAPRVITKVCHLSAHTTTMSILHTLV